MSETLGNKYKIRAICLQRMENDVFYSVTKYIKNIQILYRSTQSFQNAILFMYKNINEICFFLII